VKWGVANTVSKKTVCPHFLSEQVCSLIIIQICQNTSKAVFGFLVRKRPQPQLKDGEKVQNITQYSEVFGPFSSQAAMKDSSCGTHRGLQSHVNLHYRSKMQKQR
jgi:hypothetical protein